MIIHASIDTTASSLFGSTSYLRQSFAHELFSCVSAWRAKNRKPLDFGWRKKRWRRVVNIARPLVASMGVGLFDYFHFLTIIWEQLVAQSLDLICLKLYHSYEPSLKIILDKSSPAIRCTPQHPPWQSALLLDILKQVLKHWYFTRIDFATS